MNFDEPEIDQQIGPQAVCVGSAEQSKAGKDLSLIDKPAGPIIDAVVIK